VADSSTLIVGSDEPLGARASLFRNLVAGSVSDPYLENVRMDTTLRIVCKPATKARPAL
jgi:hypothetical protein